MRSESRSVSINEMKEALKSELVTVTKVFGGRVWVVKAVNNDEASLINKKEVEK